MLEAKREEEWTHTATMRATLYDCHMKGGPFKPERFHPYHANLPKAGIELLQAAVLGSRQKRQMSSGASYRLGVPPGSAIASRK